MKRQITAIDPKTATKSKFGPKANLLRGTANMLLAVAVETAVIPTMDANAQPTRVACSNTIALTPVSIGITIIKTTMIDTNW